MTQSALGTLADYELAARQHMSRAVWEMVYHGSLDEWATKRIRPVFDSIALRPRMLVDSSAPSLETTLLGEPVSMPVMLAAPGMKCCVDADGERATVRAAARAQIATLIPHIADYDVPVEHLAAAADGVQWFQLYILRDRQATEDILLRAEHAGCTAVVVTVSGATPVRAPMRTNEIVNGWWTSPEYARYSANLPPPLGVAPGPEFELEYELDWSVLEWVRERTSLPVVVKGIISARDAAVAADCGVDGLIVSTHAARLFDGEMTTIEALPYAVDAVAGRCEVYVDGGFRRGADVLRGLAFGARACLIGKPIFYALATRGESGVDHILDILRGELRAAMTSCGACSIADITRDLVASSHLERL